MLSTILTFLAPKVIGAGGGIISRFIDLKEKKVDREWESKILGIKNQHELAQKEIDLRIMDKEWQFKERVVELESEKEMSISADNLQIKSYDAFIPEKDSWVFSLSAAIRPFLTMVIQLQIIYISFQVFYICKSFGVFNDLGFSKIMLDKVIDYIFVTGDVSFNWWFGQRGGFKKNK